MAEFFEVMVAGLAPELAEEGGRADRYEEALEAFQFIGEVVSDTAATLGYQRAQYEDGSIAVRTYAEGATVSIDSDGVARVGSLEGDGDIGFGVASARPWEGVVVDSLGPGPAETHNRGFVIAKFIIAIPDRLIEEEIRENRLPPDYEVTEEDMRTAALFFVDEMGLVEGEGGVARVRAGLPGRVPGDWGVPESPPVPEPTAEQPADAKGGRVGLLLLGLAGAVGAVALIARGARRREAEAMALMDGVEVPCGCSGIAGDEGADGEGSDTEAA